jgi:sugar phosphate isomerase/epimerase
MTTPRHLRSLCLLAVVCISILLLPIARATELGVERTRFTLDGKPTFLLGISYYGALGASDQTIEADLKDMREAGFNWVRVWATWAAFGGDVSAVNADGSPRKEYLDRLARLVETCDRQGIVVNVTLSRGNGATGPPRLATHAAHRRAVETLVTAEGLKRRRNWYLDLSNERNIKDQRHTSTEDLAALRRRARELDAKRLVTVSHVGDPKADEIKEYLDTVGVDFLSIHRSRHKGTAGETEARAKGTLSMMKDLGKSVPLHYDEPFRRGYAEWEPQAQDFLADLAAAKAGGAAGWCFHNGQTKSDPDGRPRRSFDLREKRLFEQLDEQERKVIAALRQMRQSP